MYRVLELNGFPKTDDCVVTFNPFNGGDDVILPQNDDSSDDGFNADEGQSNGDGESHDDSTIENDDIHSDDHGSNDDHSNDDNHSDDDASNDDHSDDHSHSDDEGQYNDGSKDDHGDDDDDEDHNGAVSITVNFIGGHIPYGHAHDLSIALSKALDGKSRRLRNSKGLIT
jgi:hypothetical protein